MRRLLILDINGVLCDKVGPDYTGPVDLALGSYRVIYREGVNDFLERCYRNFDVAFYSSTTRANAVPILDHLLTKQQQKLTRKICFRDQTFPDPDLGKAQLSFDPSWFWENLANDKIESYATIKDLRSFLSNVQDYSERNTLICDDSLLKLRFNRRKNCVIVKNENFNEVFNRIISQFNDL